MTSNSCSLRMKIEPATAAIAYLVEQQICHQVIVTDARNMLCKILCRANLLAETNHAAGLTWVCCPAGVHDNEDTDQLNGKATTQGVLRLDKLDT